ncbi:DNA-binding protein [Halobacteriales archaeon QS_1_68_20]|nr:MAG: DNA-binding protein [Halobacteriales archaeon QS_1_68_20]
MSGSPDDDDELEKLRQERMEELQDKAGGEQAEEQMEAQRQQAEAQKQAILRQHLTDGARKRLNTIRMSKPQFAEQVEQQLIALARSGRIQGKIDEDKMRELLKELKPDSQDFNIRRR